MNINSFGMYFIHDLSVMYDAERQFLQAQHQQRGQAQSELLQELLDEHIPQTQQQIAHLERIFAMINMAPVAIDDHAAAGLVTMGQRAVAETNAHPQLTDCAIVQAIIKIEHYESACYRALIAATKPTDHDELLILLEQNLSQESLAASKAEDAYTKLLGLAIATQNLERAIGKPFLVG